MTTTKHKSVFVLALGLVGASVFGWVAYERSKATHNADTQSMTARADQSQQAVTSTIFKPVAHFDPSIYPKSNEPLSDTDEKAFFDDVYSFFGADVMVLDKESQTAALSKLNMRMGSGVASAIRYLHTNPSDTDVMNRRMALVEYLRYRAKWDAATKAVALEYVTTPIMADLPLNIKAMKIQEKAELMEGLARFDGATVSVLGQLSDPVEKRYVAASIANGLRNGGLSEDELKRKVREFYPEFLKQS